MRLYLILGAFFIAFQSAGQESPKNLLMYYMPYDNDLGVYADTILAQLENDLEEVAVTVLLDRPGPGGLELYLNDSDFSEPEENIAMEESSSTEALDVLLSRSTEKYRARNSALFFLNHAGSLNELGLDTYPDSSWLKMSDVSASLQLHTMWFGKLDFIYYQVCSKSSLEALYEHIDYGRTMLASQLVLGAPNYYYGDMIEELRDMDGFVPSLFAQKAAKNERPDMYHSLTQISPTTLWHLKEKLSILLGPPPHAPVEIPLTLVHTFQYGGLTYVDMKSLIKYLRKYLKWDRRMCREICHLIKEIELYRGHMSPMFIGEGFSGLSICLTPTDDDLSLKFYDGGKLPFVIGE